MESVDFPLRSFSSPTWIKAHYKEGEPQKPSQGLILQKRPPSTSVITVHTR